MSRSFFGQKIKEGVDYIRVPSLNLTLDELNSIPEPPSFSNIHLEDDADIFCDDNCDNSDEDDRYLASRNNDITKKLRKNRRVSKTIKLQNRLSSLSSQFYEDPSEREFDQPKTITANNNLTKTANFPNPRNSSLLHKSLIPSPLSNIVEEENIAEHATNSNQYKSDIIQTQNIQLFPVLVEPAPVNIPNLNDNSDAFSNLYGEDEESIMKAHRANTPTYPNEDFGRNSSLSQHSVKTANEVLFDEILSSYMTKQATVPQRHTSIADTVQWAKSQHKPISKTIDGVQYSVPEIQLPPDLGYNMNMRLKSLVISPPVNPNTRLNRNQPFLDPPTRKFKNSSISTFDGSIVLDSENDMSSLGDKLYMSSPEAKCSNYSEFEEQDDDNDVHSSVYSDLRGVSSEYSDLNFDQQGNTDPNYLIDTNASKIEPLRQSTASEYNLESQSVSESVFKKSMINKTVIAAPVPIQLDFDSDSEDDVAEEVTTKSTVSSGDSDMFYDAM